MVVAKAAKVRGNSATRTVVSSTMVLAISWKLRGVSRIPESLATSLQVVRQKWENNVCADSEYIFSYVHYSERSNAYSSYMSYVVLTYVEEEIIVLRIRGIADIRALTLRTLFLSIKVPTNVTYQAPNYLIGTFNKRFSSKERTR